jgi:Phage tail sheath C-terminal domain
VASSAGTRANAILNGKRKKEVVKISAKTPGTDGNGIKVVVLDGQSENTVRIEVSAANSPPETFDNLVMNKDSENYLVNVLNNSSKIVVAEAMVPDPSPELHNPIPQEITLSGGENASLSATDYENALGLLELEPNVDIVMACSESSPQVHSLIQAHCEKMSLGKEPNALAPRIGIGTVGQNEPVDQILQRIETLASDRFVIAAPYGYAGSVAGLLSKLNYYESPTFKPISVITEFGKRYSPSEQMKLVSSGILTLDPIKGRGIVVVKGITSKGQQINVIRIADRAVRGIKNITDDYIGELNNQRKRTALREKITEFLLTLDRDGAIVPSTDMTQPSFLVDVYSSQADFAQGIVKVDLAVRPVRAIDYIYARLTVQS